MTAVDGRRGTGPVLPSRAMQVSDFDYPLPKGLIADHPVQPRRSSRLLELTAGGLQDRRMTDFPDLLDAGDLLVFNNTRVIPARLLGHKATGGKVEVLIERLLSDNRVLAHVRASKAPKTGTLLQLADEAIQAEVCGRQDDFFELVFHGGKPVLELLDRYGHVPLPPYIRRQGCISMPNSCSSWMLPGCTRRS
jgi:S-adenosylmethionine:tRNA ribosyltransferase-isomerase